MSFRFESSGNHLSTISLDIILYSIIITIIIIIRKTQ